jgi:integrase
MVTSFVFTQATIKALAAPETGRVYHKDRTFPGLQVCVTATGHKTFYFVKRVSGKPKRLWLGTVTQLSVASARKAAAKQAATIAGGADPQSERLFRRNEPTLAMLWQSYFELHSRPQNKSWKDDQRRYQNYMQDLHNKRLSAITKAVVAKWHAQIGQEHGPVQANRCKEQLSSMFGKASGAVGYTGPNPCRGVANFPERSRERFLLPAEMHMFFTALAAEEPYWQGFFLLCLFTGCRRGNVQSMEWAEVDLENALWHIPGAKVKNGRPTSIALCLPAVAILKARQQLRNGSPYVFPALRGSGPLRSVQGPWERIRAAAGVNDLRIHDLRRTQGSWQAAMGISLAIIGKSLGHANLQSTQVYARLDVDPVRDAVSRASDSMIRAAGFHVGAGGVELLTERKEAGDSDKL